MARGKYDDEDKARVLAVLQANDGNVKRTARETGVAEQTVRDWKRAQQKGTLPAATSAALPAAVGEFVDDAKRIRGMALQEIELRVQNGEGTLRDLITTVGILDDKIRLSEGKPTGRVEHEHSGQTPEAFAPVFAEYLQRSFDSARQREADIDIPEDEVVEQADVLALPETSSN